MTNREAGDPSSAAEVEAAVERAQNYMNYSTPFNAPEIDVLLGKESVEDEDAEEYDDAAAVVVVEEKVNAAATVEQASMATTTTNTTCTMLTNGIVLSKRVFLELLRF